MPPDQPIRCPAFIARDGESTAVVAVHFDPCTFVHPFEEAWDRAVVPDAATIQAYRQQHPITPAGLSEQQQLMNECFGPDDDGEPQGESSSRKIPRWQDLDPKTVDANLAVLNAAMAEIDMPTMQVQMDVPNPAEGPVVSWSSTGGYTYPRDIQYSRPYPLKRSFAELWADIQKNARVQWDEAHGKIQNRAAGSIGGRPIMRPVINTAPAPPIAGPSTLRTPLSPDKRKRDDMSIKSELSSLSGLAPDPKRPRRDEDIDAQKRDGEQLLEWSHSIQAFLHPESLPKSSRQKVEAIGRVLLQLEGRKDRVSANHLGRHREKGGTKLGMWIRKLANTENVPYDDEFVITKRAENLTSFWAKKFGGGSGGVTEVG